MHLLAIAAPVVYHQVLDALGETGLLARLLHGHPYNDVKAFAEYLCLLHNQRDRASDVSPMPNVDAVWHHVIKAFE